MARSKSKSRSRQVDEERYFIVSTASLDKLITAAFETGIELGEAGKALMSVGLQDEHLNRLLEAGTLLVEVEVTDVQELQLEVEGDLQ